MRVLAIGVPTQCDKEQEKEEALHVVRPWVAKFLTRTTAQRVVAKRADATPSLCVGLTGRLFDEPEARR